MMSPVSLKRKYCLAAASTGTKVGCLYAFANVSIISAGEQQSGLIDLKLNALDHKIEFIMPDFP